MTNRRHRPKALSLLGIVAKDMPRRNLGVTGNKALINPIIFGDLANDFLQNEKDWCQHFLQVVKEIRPDFSTGWRDREPGHRHRG
jgi:hypothetical protein